MVAQSKPRIALVWASLLPSHLDRLARNLVNGFVIENDSREGFAQAMLALCRVEALRERMAAASTRLAPLADAARFAGAVETLLNPRGQIAAGNAGAPLPGLEGLPR